MRVLRRERRGRGLAKKVLIPRCGGRSNSFEVSELLFLLILAATCTIGFARESHVEVALQLGSSERQSRLRANLRNEGKVWIRLR